MRKSFLTLVMGLSSLAMSAVNVGDPSGHYLYARLDGQANWGQTSYQFSWANAEGTKIYLNVPGGLKANNDDKGFCVSDANQKWTWNMTIVGGQKSGDDNNIINWEEAINCYYGGNGNLRFPSTDTFKSIVIELPTNQSGYDATNGNPPVANAGKLTVSKNEYKPEGIQEDSNEKVSYWLRGNLFGSGKYEGFEETTNPDYQFRKDPETGVYYVNFTPGLRVGDKTDFAISEFSKEWGKTIVPGSNTAIAASPAGTENVIFFGGGHNAKLPSGDYIITRIEIVKEPTNNQADYNWADNNTPAEPSAEEAGILKVYGYNPSAGKPIVDKDGKSNMMFQVWDGTGWDTSGGFFAPLNDHESAFYKKYGVRYEKWNTDFMAAVPAPAESIVDADPDGKALSDYDPATQVIRYNPDAAVYVIDFTEYDENGLLLKVPVKSDMGEAGDSELPMILRSGIRFGFINNNYDADNHTNDRYRYVKYGRAFRLNAVPMSLVGPNDKEIPYYMWNNQDVRTNPNPSNENLTTIDNKFGDNRLLSEYDLYLKRIVIEVENEGMGASENITLRFEGRYDFTPVAEVDYSYSFADADIKAPNHRGDEPNIFSSATYRWYDRAFTRFYANDDPTLHGCKTDAELKELAEKYGLPTYKECYDAEVEYNLLDAAGNDYEYVDVDGDNNTTATTARYTRKYGYLYGSGGWGYYMYNENGSTIGGPTKMPMYNFTEKNEDTNAEATRLTILGKELTLVYDHDNLSTLPKEMVAKITYHFYDDEPNNVPTYDQTPVVNGNAGEMGMTVNLEGEALSWAKADGDKATYNARLSIENSDFLHVDSYVNVDGKYEKVERYAPIKRWEFRGDMKDNWTIMDDWLPETSTYNSPAVTSKEYNAAHDSNNTDRNAVLTVTTAEQSKRPTAGNNVEIVYRADAIVRRGRIISNMLLTEAALKQTVFVDKDGNEINNIYATDALKGTTRERDGVAYEINETQLPAHLVLEYTTTTAIDPVESTVSAVTVEGRTVSADGETVAVYTVTGALVGNGKTVTVPGAGLYIVNSNGNNIKIIVK